MTKTTRIDWKGGAAVIAGALCTGAAYLVALAVLFGPMAHAVVRLR